MSKTVGSLDHGGPKFSSLGNVSFLIKKVVFHPPRADETLLKIVALCQPMIKNIYKNNISWAS